MCTLTILRRNGQTLVTMNRDEARGRHEGDLVKGQIQGIGYLHPLDAQGGGSWFGCNNQGLIAALLNRYQDPQQAGLRSRGALVTQALRLGKLERALESLNQQSMAPYNPFELLLIDGQQIQRLSWNGQVLLRRSIERREFMISSSKLHPEQTLPNRRALFAEWQKHHGRDESLAQSVLKFFHMQQDSAQPQHSVLMDRSDAHSKSICQVSANNSGLEFCYYPTQSLSRVREQGCQAIEAIERYQLDLQEEQSYA